MPSVVIKKTDNGRWHVWTRTSGGRRRVRLGVYLAGLERDGHSVRASNLRQRALALGATARDLQVPAKRAPPVAVDAVQKLADLVRV